MRNRAAVILHNKGYVRVMQRVAAMQRTTQCCSMALAAVECIHTLHVGAVQAP